MIKEMYDVKREPDEDEEKSKCGSAFCTRKARYRVAFDFISIFSFWVVYVCEEHYNPILKTLRKSKTEFKVYDLSSGKEKVEFT